MSAARRRVPLSSAAAEWDSPPQKRALSSWLGVMHVPEGPLRKLLLLFCAYQLFLHAKPSEPHLVRRAA